MVSVEPAAITLELERRQTLNVPVRPDIQGSPAPGYVLASVHVVPTQVAVQGPESRLEDLDFVKTTPISVAGATGPIESNAQPVLPDPLLRLLSSIPIQVIVEIQPQPKPTPRPD